MRKVKTSVLILFHYALGGRKQRTPIPITQDRRRRLLRIIVGNRSYRHDRRNTDKEDFSTLANRIEVVAMKRGEHIKMFSEKHPLIEVLIDHSFVDNKSKRMYNSRFTSD